jgi:hypothetical protein
MELSSVHVAVLVCTALVIAYADHEAFLYIRGEKQTLNKVQTRWLHRGVWLGLSLMIITGVLMVAPAYDYYLGEPAFLIKMLLVGLLIGNGVAIGALTSVAAVTPFRELSKRKKLLLLLSGALSSLGWLGAVAIGFFLL